MQWPLWPFLRYFVDVSVHNDGDWLHLAYLKCTWYVPHAISQYYCNGVLKIKSANQKRSKIFKDENILFQKRKNVEARCYMMWHSTFSQNSKISCFVPTCSITFFFFFLSNYNLKLSHMDVCIILQKKHLTVYKHSYDCFQHYPSSVTLLLLAEAGCTSVL